MGTYLFAGASSKIAVQTALLLKKNNHSVLGISTKPVDNVYDHLYAVEKYDFSCFPAINDVIDGLIYFPGTINLKPFNRFSPQDFRDDYQINSLGAVAFIQSYLPNLKQSKQASIVLISTVAVSTGMAFHSSIAMAKGAVEGLTKSLAAEFAPSIRVNCVAPSLVNSPLSEKFLNTPEKVEASQKRNPLKKIGEAEEVAKTLEFLVTPASSWITGQIIAVDGGMSSLKIL